MTIHAPGYAEDYSPLTGALDRCEHGRHVRDTCVSCPGGQSAGNLFLQPGIRIGTTLYGAPIVAPELADRSNPETWVQAPDGNGAGRWK